MSLPDRHRCAVAAVGVAVAVALLAGCGSAAPATAPSPAGPPGGLDAVLATTLARARADGTARSSDRTSIVLGHTEFYSAAGESSLRIDPQGPSVIATSTARRAGGPPSTRRLVVRPEAVYVSDSAPGAPPSALRWTRLDAASRDPASGTDYGALVELQRQTGSRIFCFTELGAASLTGATRDVLDGVPVMRYSLRIDLTRPGGNVADADQYRQLGLASLDTAMYVDAADRVRRCAFEQELPNGAGRVATDQVFRDFGAPVDVPAPAADQVTG